MSVCSTKFNPVFQKKDGAKIIPFFRFTTGKGLSYSFPGIKDALPAARKETFRNPFVESVHKDVELFHIRLLKDFPGHLPHILKAETRLRATMQLNVLSTRPPREASASS